MEFYTKNFKIKTSFQNLAIIVCSLLLFEIFNNNLILLIIISALVHEIGHILIMNFLKCKPKEVYIGIFDIVIVDLNYYKRSFLYDEIILLSGPFFNIFFASLALLINSLSSFKYQWLDDLFFTNMTLGIFNLMPIIPLDGGQVLYSFLLSKTEEKKAKTISLTISFSILFPSAVIGFLILLNKKNDFSLLFTSFYLIIMLLTKKNTII